MMDEAGERWYNDNNNIFRKKVPDMKIKIIALMLLVLGLWVVTGCKKQENRADVTIDVVVSPEGSGTVAKNREAYKYEDGVILTATPAEGYIFKNWAENGQSLGITKNVYKFRALANRTVTAVFVPSYNLSVNVTPEKSGRTTSEAKYEANTEVTVTAKANYGYDFVRWIDKDNNEVSSQEEYTFTIGENTVLTAVFEKVQTSAASEIITFGVIVAFIAGGIYLSFSLKKKRSRTNPSAK
jgi:hypothetical protein